MIRKSAYALLAPVFLLAISGCTEQQTSEDEARKIAVSSDVKEKRKIVEEGARRSMTKTAKKFGAKGPFLWRVADRCDQGRTPNLLEGKDYDMSCGMSITMLFGVEKPSRDAVERVLDDSHWSEASVSLTRQFYDHFGQKDNFWEPALEADGGLGEKVVWDVPGEKVTNELSDRAKSLCRDVKNALYGRCKEWPRGLDLADIRKNSASVFKITYGIGYYKLIK
ncbi:hypothetical protein ACQUSR_27050 [Streptomyces sp. P1-3]|uniref:hypothetical protein n=1 Tax=Streptomyces sp. P1-3 TaxID=3421658 RepID=UPI003D35A636